MSEEFENETQIVEIYDEAGETTKCEVYDVIDFEEKTYVLLCPISDDNESDESEMIVMQFIEEGEEGYFQNIEDEDEFERVCEYIQSFSEDEEDEGEE